ncbi:MAG TPA: hypothetical protein VKA21_15285 [Candidatus Binatia bacterium]|nr:hypothetical protein [Candidatus Binatia bacterium]
MPRRTAALVCALVTLVAAPARGVLLDAGFGTGGRVQGTYDANTNTGLSRGAGVVVEPVTGRIFVATERGALARFLPDGTLDASFGTGGQVAVVDPAVRRLLMVVRQPTDGKLLVVGYALGPGSSHTGTVIRRYDADGNLDAGFGTAGEVAISQPPHPSAVVGRADGTIVVAGNAWAFPRFPGVLLRFLADGTPDASFGSGGVVVTGTTAGAGNLLPLALLEDGTGIIAGGTDDATFTLARYLADGTLDAAFGTGGFVSTPFPAYPHNEIFDLVRQADGKIVAVGSAWLTAARYLANGTLDASYGSGGTFHSATGAGGQSFLDASGRIVVGGGNLLARLTDDGAYDPSFAPCLVAFDAWVRAGDNGVALQDDGKIVVVGSDYPGKALRIARYVEGIATCQPATARGAKLSVRPLRPGTALGDAGPKLKWSWKSSAAVALADYGDPVADDADGYTLCLLGTASTPDVAGTFRVLPNQAGSCMSTNPNALSSCWRGTSSQYRRRYGVHGGATFDVKVRAGGPRAARIGVRALGDWAYAIPFPPYPAPVTVRFDRTPSPFCWEATLSAPSRNDDTAFSGKSD